MPTPIHEQPVCESSKRVRMLYVEDDVIGAGLVKRSLERTGEFRVELAENGSLGLDMAKRDAYDILLVDNDMPEMGGLELMAGLQAGGYDIPAIMITGAGDEKTAIDALKSGYKDYIVKDVEGAFLQLLPAVVGQVLQQEASGKLLAEKNLENQRLVQELLETNKKLKELNERKNEVLGIAAHDLRNELTAIATAVGYLIEAEEDRESRRFKMLDMCRGSITQAVNLVKELLNPQRLEAGDLELRIEALPFDTLLREVIELNRANAEKKRIEVKLFCETEARGSIDSFRFRVLADNLLTNALKYSPLGSVVELRIFSEADRVCLSVKDQGPGFTEEDRTHMYERFRRLSARPTANESSTGLGLSIVRKMADLHNAEIRLESSSGQGAKFVVGFQKADSL